MRGKGRGGWRGGQQQHMQQQQQQPQPPQQQQQQQQQQLESMHEHFAPVGQDHSMSYYSNTETTQEVTMQQDNGTTETTERPLKPWEKGTGGTKMKRKKVPGAKNLKIRRYVQPKNAVMCLNELRSGLQYVSEKEGGVQVPFCMSVEVDGQKYKGYGSSKQLARQAAAEAALISFVKPPDVNKSLLDPTADTDATESLPEPEDKTPWAALASFAIYKLFSDWRDGRVGMYPSSQQPFSDFSSATQFYGATPPKVESSTGFMDTLSRHLVGSKQETVAKKVSDSAQVPNPAKTLPNNAHTMHPVMILHQMRPSIVYENTQVNRENRPYFFLSANIDGQTFTGEGSNIKKAKYNLAQEAVKSLFSIVSTFQPQGE